MGELEKGRTGWRGVGGSLSGPTDDIVSPAQHRAAVAAENLKHVATDQAESARRQIRSFAETGKDRVADQLDHVARALRGAGEQLRGDEEQQQISQYTDIIGDRVEQVSRYLRDHQAIDLVDGIERVARRQPLLFLGGAFAVGLVIGRVLKSGASASGSGSSGWTEPGADTGYGSTGPGDGGVGTGGYGSYGGGSGTPGSYGTSGDGPGAGSSSGYRGSFEGGYPMGGDVQVGYPEPEQAIGTPRGTSVGKIPGDFSTREGASPTTPIRGESAPPSGTGISGESGTDRLPGDDDESR